MRASTDIGGGVSLFGTVLVDRWLEDESTGVTSYIGLERTFTLFGDE